MGVKTIFLQEDTPSLPLMHFTNFRTEVHIPLLVLSIDGFTAELRFILRTRAPRPHKLRVRRDYMPRRAAVIGITPISQTTQAGHLRVSFLETPWNRL